MIDAIETVEQVLSVTNRVMLPRDKAEAITKLYYYYSEIEDDNNSTPSNAEKLTKVIKLIANYD